MSIRVSCPLCDGCGQIANMDYPIASSRPMDTCYECGGSGEILVPDDEFDEPAPTTPKEPKNE